MENLTVSDKESNCRYIAYVAGVLAAASSGAAAADIRFADGRVCFSVNAEQDKLAELRKRAEEKIADVICVGYKYEFLSRLIRPAGLSAEDREILVAAIIAADFADDRRYVLSGLKKIEVHTIDGFYNFRLRALTEKWRGVAQCVPLYFDKERLAEFMEFLLGGNKGKVFLKGPDVYDCRCRRLHRAALIEGGKSEMNTLREIVLSGAGKVECLTAPSLRQENFLRRYYAGRVGFSGI